MATAQQYYDDSSQHGNYQYISLDDIIAAMEMEAQSEDSFMKNTKRSRIIYEAKQGVKELNKGTANDIKAFEITVGSDLKVILPQDYVNYVRISLVMDDFKLVPLDINRNMSIAKGYLQDNNYQILFDGNGEVLQADASNAFNKPYQIYEFMSDGIEQPYSNANNFMTDFSKASQHGSFNIDERRGAIVFSSNIAGREVVIEYVSDGVNWERIDLETITVHKYLEHALREYIYYHCIARNRNVPYIEKQRSLARYKTLKHQAKLDLSDFKMIEFKKAMRSKTKWL